MSQKTAVVLSSGGIDSTTLLYYLIREKGFDVYALGVDYGQLHRRELDSARSICSELGVGMEIADLTAVRELIGRNDRTVPDGCYTEEVMKVTISPNRNMIMIAVATGFAINIKADYVAYAAHGGDHTIYPDCRPVFTEALGAAIRLADWHEVGLLRPFIEMSKADIVRLGALELGVPYEKTWSCYRDGEKHCRKCATCVERKEAFELVGVTDPTEYEE